MKQLVIEMRQEVWDELHRIRQRMELLDDVTVVKHALSVYSYCVGIVADGGKIIACQADGRNFEVEIK